MNFKITYIIIISNIQMETDSSENKHKQIQMETDSSENNNLQISFIKLDNMKNNKYKTKVNFSKYKTKNNFE